MVRVPRFEYQVDGEIRVTQWGRAGDVLFRAGDSLVVDGVSRSDLLVLLPRGRGRPMLGRFGKHGLLAEPGGVRASDCRWRVLGQLSAVERCLERNGSDGEGGFVSVRVQGDDLAQVARARGVFVGRRMTARELSDFCSHAAVAPEHFGVSVAVAVADEPAIAQQMLEQVPAGRIRRQVKQTEARPGQLGVVVPGPWLSAVGYETVRRLVVDDERQLGLFAQGQNAG
jgi:hypothetical protein